MSAKKINLKPQLTGIKPFSHKVSARMSHVNRFSLVITSQQFSKVFQVYSFSENPYFKNICNEIPISV